MRNAHEFITADWSLVKAARATQRASKACRGWELGGPSEAVGETADAALVAVKRAMAAIQNEEETVLTAGDPGTRRGRLVLAGYMLLLAGTDEHGESADLTSAGTIFRRAAVA